MKIVQINVTCGKGSTGRICLEVSQELSEAGIENCILYSAGKTNSYNAIAHSNKYYEKIEAIKSHINGNYGFNSELSTWKLLKILDNFKPDVLHLHNLHGHNVHLTMLFEYIKKKQIKIYWTFHDCWAFTGYCPHFSMMKCDKWKRECKNCPQLNEYSFFFDKSKVLFNRKRELFHGLDMTIITPSVWLSKLVQESFLNEYPIKIINNGIDLSVFHPMKSNFRKNCGIRDDQFMILGVAFGWSQRKGLDVFIELSKRLNPKVFRVVLIGTNKKIDSMLPENIISIHKTENQNELAEIYTASDLFVNPTREENYPTVNMEAIACGTPVVTFNTGGSAEMLDETVGSVVPVDDIEYLEKEIIWIYENRPYSTDVCLKKAKTFDKKRMTLEYLNLYKSSVVNEKTN